MPPKKADETIDGAESAADLETETAAPPLAPKQSTEVVLVTITKFGAGKVSTGVHVAGPGDIMAIKGEILEVSRTVAEALEAKGFAEAE